MLFRIILIDQAADRDGIPVHHRDLSLHHLLIEKAVPWGF